MLGAHQFFRAATVLSLAACASSGATSNAQRSSDQVNRAEIAATPVSNAYELIERLRPNWLRSPGMASIGGGAHSQIVVVYLDGQRLGDLESLRTLSASEIQSMQWLDAARAETVLHEVGSDPIRGAILIKTH